MAMKMAVKIGVRVEVIRTKELDNPLFVNNPIDRCYFCKSELFDKISEMATSGCYLNMVDGTNYDDMNSSAREKSPRGKKCEESPR